MAILLDRFQRDAADWNDPFFSSFSDYARRFAEEIHVGNVERNEFAQAQAATVKQFQNGDVSCCCPCRSLVPAFCFFWRGQQLVTLTDRENARESFLHFGQLDFP